MKIWFFWSNTLIFHHVNHMIARLLRFAVLVNTLAHDFLFRSFLFVQAPSTRCRPRFENANMFLRIRKYPRFFPSTRIPKIGHASATSRKGACAHRQEIEEHAHFSGRNSAFDIVPPSTCPSRSNPKWSIPCLSLGLLKSLRKVQIFDTRIESSLDMFSLSYVVRVDITQS